MSTDYNSHFYQKNKINVSKTPSARLGPDSRIIFNWIDEVDF